MKNRVVSIICYFVVFSLSANGQYHTHPNLGNVVPYQIQITDRATTLIAFPYSVIDADCGISELRAEKVPDVSNIIKVKASKPNIDTTSLHVFTADGKFYVFQVAYHAAPGIIAYDLRDSNSMPLKVSVEDFSNGIKEHELTNSVNKVRTLPEFLRRNSQKFQMKIRLGGIYVYNNMLFVKFRISNNSQLNYRSGLVNMYMRDKNAARRSSVQQLPVKIIYHDSLPCVNGKQQTDWILTIPKTTIPNKKELIFEMQELNGGRNVSISIRNRHILRAKPV